MGLLNDILGSPLFSNGYVPGGMPPDVAGGSGDAPSSAFPPFQLAPGQDAQPDFGSSGAPLPAPRPPGADFPDGNVPMPQPRPPDLGMTSAPAGMNLRTRSDIVTPASDELGGGGAPMALQGGGGGGGLAAALGLNNPD